MAHQTGNVRVVLNHVNVWFHEDIVAVKSPPNLANRGIKCYRTMKSLNNPCA
jgi:hypothetical protein